MLWFDPTSNCWKRFPGHFLQLFPESMRTTRSATVPANPIMCIADHTWCLHQQIQPFNFGACPFFCFRAGEDALIYKFSHNNSHLFTSNCTNKKKYIYHPFALLTGVKEDTENSKDIYDRADRINELSALRAASDTTDCQNQMIQTLKAHSSQKVLHTIHSTPTYI